MAVLEAKELYRFFHAGDDEVKALRGVDLTLDAGEIIALIGPSGSGKSTLLLCLSGLDEPDGGMVSVCSEPMSRRPELAKTRLRSKYLGVMLQKENLFAHLTVAENVGMNQALSGGADHSLVAQLLASLGLENRADALPAQLSGGEKARAGLAVALSRRAQILLLDEPTGEVDADTEKTILDVLETLRREGGSIVVATHNAAVANFATRTLTMSDGKIVNG